MDASACRDLARDLIDAGIAAADPHARVAAALAAAPLVAPPGGRRLLLAIGKAAVRMTEGALSAWDEPPPDLALLVTNDGNARDIGGCTVLATGHPLPDARGLAAGRAVEEAVAGLSPQDRVLVLISGGGSALLPAPVDGVPLDDLIALNRLLLGAGLDIRDVNRVRQPLSRLKGGGLARLAWPAPVRTLALSDVFDDDPRVIASGPTRPPLGGPSDAATSLRRHGLWRDVPSSIRAALSREDASPPTPDGPYTLVGSNRLSVRAMAEAAADRGWTAHVEEAPVTGEVDAVARHLVARLDGLEEGQTWLLGGETTVQLTGDGLGGRNQELALRVAHHAHAHGLRPGWVFAAAGSDGRDGPTDAAGGCVDAGTTERIRAAGGDVEALLANNDAYHALDQAGDLLRTGPTGTNVADLMVLLRA